VNSDFFVLMRAWQYADQHNYSVDACRQLGIHAQSARQVRPLFEQFLRLAKAEGLPSRTAPRTTGGAEVHPGTGFADHLARRLDGGTLRCQLVHQRRGHAGRARPPCATPAAGGFRGGGDRGTRCGSAAVAVTVVKPEWLRELFPEGFREQTVAVWDEPTRRAYGETQRLFRDLVLESKRSEKPPLEQAAPLLASA
jgi:ATP-dependent helicase HrpB